MTADFTPSPTLKELEKQLRGKLVSIHTGQSVMYAVITGVWIPANPAIDVWTSQRSFEVLLSDGTTDEIVCSVGTYVDLLCGKVVNGHLRERGITRYPMRMIR